MAKHIAKNRRFSEAANVARNIAGAALGAAAIAATGVVVTRVATAIQQGGKSLENAKGTLQSLAAKTVASPVLPGRKRRATARRKTAAAKASAPRRAKRAAAKRRTAKKAAAPAPA